MTYSRRLRLALAVGAMLLLATPALALEGDGTTTDADLSGQNLTLKQKKEFAAQATSDLDGATSKLLKLIEEAQRTNDIILLNCLNDKLGLLRGAQKASEDARFALEEAAARENADLVEHNFKKLYIARDSGLTLAAEAEACAGQVGSSFPGQTRVVVNVEGGGEGDDDFRVASDTDTRPPDSSPQD